MVALWAWHIPALFQAIITSDVVQTAQHISSFASALMFWWALFRRQRSYGAAALYVFTRLWVRDSDLRYRVTGMLVLPFLLTGCGPD